jgi:hypothetical protein
MRELSLAQLSTILLPVVDQFQLLNERIDRSADGWTQLIMDATTATRMLLPQRGTASLVSGSSPASEIDAIVENPNALTAGQCAVAVDRSHFARVGSLLVAKGGTPRRSVD